MQCVLSRIRLSPAVTAIVRSAVRNVAVTRDTMGRSIGQPVRDAAKAGESQPTEDHAEQPHDHRRDGAG